MKNANIDCIVCPPQVSAAYTHADAVNLFSTISYTGIYNMLDYAAGVVAITKVTKEDVSETEKTYPNSDLWDKLIHKNNKVPFSWSLSLFFLNDMAFQGSEGLPIGVQVVAPPYSEEMVMRIMHEIETLRKEA